MNWRPQPGKQHEKLHTLVGNWEGIVRLAPSAWGSAGMAVGRFSNTVVADGFFLVSDYVEQRDGGETFVGHGVYGWDDIEKEYVLYWFDSMGLAPRQPARGTWKENELVFVLEQPGGKVRYSHTFLEPGAYVFRLQSQRDDADWDTIMEAEYRRR
ncbi:MAG TPA: DUF1579 family protein [Polyangiaceae bacterium]|nr:MAG: hypothetical protein BWY17_03246 [Deltaproteobacteria bacterium ADurb.Bin207]HNS98009.1 DUF1579 family protein [Polyangiaceae bacterium]HNZ24779.1 DUF1579 family protein [Polyangiaceae bacterium]HOD25089.1 DUF1579 family protein [Polyangiaceae bacterium]HOE50522.1 DUF1579 family protein [Polyangiaceae bacterium]